MPSTSVDREHFSRLRNRFTRSDEVESLCAPLRYGPYRYCHHWLRYDQTTYRYVVIPSLDGFRPDYQGRCATPNLDAMDREGLAGRFRPSYPTLTFPNHYSMATGLYPNNHGLVGNEFWDERGARYRLGDRKAVADPAFYKGEPRWNVASSRCEVCQLLLGR